jgi:hypothetical protein
MKSYVNSPLRDAKIQKLAQRDEDFPWEEMFKSTHTRSVAQARKLFSTSTNCSKRIQKQQTSKEQY